MTLEHVADPRVLAEQVMDVLAPGGLFAVVVHDWQAPVNRVLGRRSPIIDIEHMQLFSRQSVTRLLSEVGYRGVGVRRIRNTYPLTTGHGSPRWWEGRPVTITCCRLRAWVVFSVTLPVGNLIGWGFKR